MKEPRKRGALVRSPAFRIASLAILTAVTAVFTYVVRIPVAPGQSGTSTFTFEHPGTYAFICSQAFHQVQGMKGTIVVQ